MENASKHLQIDEEEHDLFVLWFYTVISLDSLKMKKNYLFLSDWKYIIHTIIRRKIDPSCTELEGKR